MEPAIPATLFTPTLLIPPNASGVISDLTNEHHRLDILINNAGMMTEASIDELSLSEWNQHVQLNLTAPFLLTKYALPWLKKSARKKGAAAIVNIGSIEGLGANPNHAAYCATKSGLHGLTRAIATDHGEDGIRCNAVAPGWIDTKLNLDFVAAMPDPEKFRQQIGEIHPLGRTGSTEEVAALVCWLASAQSSFVTGQIYTIDGGRMTKLSLPQ